MKQTRPILLLALALILGLAVTGCKHKPTNVTPLPGNGPGSVAGTEHTQPIGSDQNPTASPTPGGTPQADPSKFKDYNRDDKIFASDVVHFDFDSSVVKASEKPKVTAVASQVRSTPGAAVEVQGHCDERGTEGYNSSLGERRALAIRDELIADGVDGGFVVTITYGKDRPAVPGHDESAWRQNRRGEFVLLTPPAK